MLRPYLNHQSQIMKIIHPEQHICIFLQKIGLEMIFDQKYIFMKNVNFNV